MESLRRISSRARITPVSFTNSYNWGDLKADPLSMLERFFDVYVYSANWMTARLSIRLPLDALTPDIATLMTNPETLNIEKKKTCWIISWTVFESGDYGRFGDDSGEGWMARLAPLRDELLRGDIRSLYIGWLGWKSLDITQDISICEPMRPPGLGKLTAAQRALAEFIEVDDDLLAGAGIGDTSVVFPGPEREAREAWLRTVPYDEVIALLVDMLGDSGSDAARKLKSMHTAWLRSLQDEHHSNPFRTIEELLSNSVIAASEREKREKRAQQQREKKQRMKREQELKQLAKDYPAAWRNVEQTLQRRSGLSYKEAVALLLDLSEAYALETSESVFTAAMKKFMENHVQRKAFVQRLVDAGLWK